jgi:hypothetical protein
MSNDILKDTLKDTLNEYLTSAEAKQVRELLNIPAINSLSVKIVELINSEVGARHPFAAVGAVCIVIHSIANASPKPAPEIINKLFSAADDILNMLRGVGLGIKHAKPEPGT